MKRSSRNHDKLFQRCLEALKRGMEKVSGTVIDITAAFDYLWQTWEGHIEQPKADSFTTC